MTRALAASLDKRALPGTLFLPIFLALLVAALGGCSRNPQVVKQKYLDKGKAYAEKGKCAEAEIEFQNAIQIDSQFEPAHYQLGLCYLKEGVFQRAYLELARAVQISPGDLKAQIELADLLLAGRKPADARDHAELVLKSDPQNVQAQVVISEADAALGDVAKAIDRSSEGHSVGCQPIGVLHESRGASGTE